MVQSEVCGNKASPVLSVVVTIVDGGDVLRRFLVALTRQQEVPPMEVIVAYDASVAETAELQDEFPNVRFLYMGVIETDRPIRSAAGQHELYDRRRAAGLAAGRGRLVAILEDRGTPQPDWAWNVVRLHEQPYGVIGGAIEPASDSLLNWALYACDFGRYGLPFESGPVRWVSDVNVSYKRRVLDEARDLWRERFREPVVHWALLEKGETLYLSPDPVVQHRRPPRPLTVLLAERFHWGRLFGHIRAMYLSMPKRLAYTVLAPFLPLVLLVRHGRTQRRKGHFSRFLWAAPAIMILLLAWTAGEVWGCLTKRA